MAAASVTVAPAASSALPPAAVATPAAAGSGLGKTLSDAIDGVLSPVQARLETFDVVYEGFARDVAIGLVCAAVIVASARVVRPGPVATLASDLQSAALSAAVIALINRFATRQPVKASLTPVAAEHRSRRR